MMRFKFDANQEYQLDAVQAVTDLFEGQPSMGVNLPSWFRVKTPVRDYQPDWAIVMEGREQDGRPVPYLVAERKSAQDG